MCQKIIQEQKYDIINIKKIKNLFIDALVRVCIGHNLIINYQTEPPYLKIKSNYQKEL